MARVAGASSRKRSQRRGTAPNDDLCAILGMLKGRKLASLSILLGMRRSSSGTCRCAMPPVEALQALPNLTELEICDASYSRATEHGACNLLGQQSSAAIRSTSDAMVSLACGLPHLRRLSLSAGIFSAEAVGQLSKLQHLEALSLAGAMECDSVAGAASVYARLFAAMPRLVSLRLPLALPSPTSCLYESEDDEEVWTSLEGSRRLPLRPGKAAIADGAGASDAPASSAGQPPAAAAHATEPAAAARAAARRVAAAAAAEKLPALALPPLLEHLTICNCDFNRPVLDAVVAQAASQRQHGLRSLHLASLAGASHWDGSLARDEQDFEKLSQLSSLEVLHISLELNHLALPNGQDPSAAVRRCFQRLHALRNLKDLRVSTAHAPTFFAARKPASATMAGTFTMPAAPPGANFDALLRVWPNLQRLVFFREVALRRGTHLVVPAWHEAGGVSGCACTCCFAASLMAPAGPPAAAAAIG